MCELFAMSCRYPARLTVSLAALARRAQLPSRNQDGWGLAYYQERDVALYRDVTSADHHPLAEWLIQHGPASRTAIGYIRHSTQGDVTLANTGPFTRELNGRIHTFVHNGNLKNLESIIVPGCSRFQPVGETDSELAFCGLLEKMTALPLEVDGLASLDARMATLATMAVLIRDCGPSNFVYSDSDVLFVHADQRFQDKIGRIAPPALHMFSCGSDEVPGLVCDAEPPFSAVDQRVFLLATVPLSDHPWQPLARGQILALRNGAIVASTAI